MKILAAHTQRGDIEHVIVLPADAPPASVGGAAQGHLLTELDAAELHLDLKKPEELEKLGDAIRTYRVDVKTRGQLQKK